MDRLIVLEGGNSPSGNQGGIVPATFEEAFGEYSNIFGKRARKRRQKRRMTRIANRAERKQARQAIRINKKNTRAEAIAGRKRLRADTKNYKAEQKDYRSRLGDDAPVAEEAAPEEQYTEDQTAYTDPNAGYAQEEQYAPEEQYAEDPNAGYTEEDQQYAEEEFQFDGNLAESDSHFLGADGAVSKINPKVQEVANKIEWQKELLGRLKINLHKAKGLMRFKMLKAIEKSEARIKELEALLHSYTDVSEARGKRGKRREAAKARRVARRKRLKSGLGSMLKKKGSSGEEGGEYEDEAGYTYEASQESSFNADRKNVIDDFYNAGGTEPTFWAKHKKKVIIGGSALLLAGLLIWANKKCHWIK